MCACTHVCGGEATQPLIQWVPGTKCPGCEANHSHLSSAEVKDAWNFTSSSPYILMVECFRTGTVSLFHIIIDWLHIGVKVGKVKLSLCLCTAWLKVLRWNFFTFLTLSLDGYKWSACCSGFPLPKERAFDTQWIGGWVSPIAILDVMTKRK